jgi:hypothetical protein
MANLNFVHGAWINLEKPGGAVFFVGGGTVANNGVGASDIYKGITPEKPLATLSQAHTQAIAGRGDTIVLLPGSITLTSALTVSKDDVTISGTKGQGNINPSSIIGTLGSTGDIIGVTGANVVIEDIHFGASTAANTSRINVGAAGLTVRGCTFNCGVNDLETITIPAAGLHTNIDGNRFFVTANGPDAAIEIESASAHFITIQNNVFHGQNTTNQWDVGAVNSAVAHLDCVLSGNTSTEGPAFIFSAAATGMISLNTMGSGTLASMLDPGSCMCSQNFEADAIDQTARLFPTTVAS